MANLKISEDLFLEKQELNRLKRFLEFDGFKQEFLLGSSSFGLVAGYNQITGVNTPPKDCFHITNLGSSANTVNVNPGRAVDKFANIITSDAGFTLSVPNTGLWYWVKIKYKTVNYEKGTVNIDVNGNLTGFGTSFTEVLRGQPNFPTKVKFVDALNNVKEYQVVDVISDSSAILSGDFLSETGLKYAVMGTFTPGFSPANSNKLIYEYDDVEITLVTEITSGIAPSKAIDEEFWLARLRTTGLNIEIQDKRTEFWQTRAEYEIHLISRFSNPIIGVESVKWDIATTPRDKNEVNLTWGYRSTNWSVDTSQNTVTINSGIGGILKENDLSQFINGSFDGWRIYTPSGKYTRIVSSTLVGTQLNLTLDFLDFDEYSNSSAELHIVPDVEEIEIKAAYDALSTYNNIVEERIVFPIHFSQGKFYVRIMDSVLPYKYNFTYRYKTVREYTEWFVFPNDKIGFYSEKSFDITGTLNINPVDREQKPYTGSSVNGFIEIVPNPRNLNIIFNEIVTGDKFGLDHKTLTNATPVVTLVVGADRQHQVFQLNNLALGNDIFINLSKTRIDSTPCINGNRFIIQLEGAFNLNTQNFRVVTDYVDPVTYDLIREIKQEDSIFVSQNQRKQRSGLVMIFTYDGTDWWLSISNEMNGVPKNTVVMYGGSINDFDNSGLGIGVDVLGWALANGNYGTTNMKAKAPVGYDPSDAMHSTLGIAGAGGSKTVGISQQNLPNYNLPITQTPHSHYGHVIQASGDWEGGGNNSAPNSTSNPGNTNGANANISVNSGGSNLPLSIMQPYQNIIFIQKIV
jgi:hypothetical protein